MLERLLPSFWRLACDCTGRGVLQQLGVLLAKALEDGTLDCSDAMVSAIALASFRSLPTNLLADLADLAAQGVETSTTEQIVNFLRLLADNNMRSGMARIHHDPTFSWCLSPKGLMVCRGTRKFLFSSGMFDQLSPDGMQAHSLMLQQL